MADEDDDLENGPAIPDEEASIPEAAGPATGALQQSAPPEGYDAVPPPPDGYDIVPTPDTSVLRDIASGAVKGFTGIGASVLKGGARLAQAAGVTDNAEDTSAYKYGQQIERGSEKLAGMVGGDTTSISGQIGSGVAQIAPVLAAGPLELMALMGMQGAAEQGDAAAAKGVNPNGATLAGAGLGVVAGGLMARMGAIVAPISRSAPGLVDWARTLLMSAAREGVVFGTVAEAQNYLGDKIAQHFYDPEQTYHPDVKRILGELGTGAVMGAFHGARAPVPQGPAGAGSSPSGTPAPPAPPPLQTPAQQVATVAPGAGNNLPSTGRAVDAGKPVQQPPQNPGSGGEGSETQYGKGRLAAAKARMSAPDTDTKVLHEISDDGDTTEADKAISDLKVFMKPGDRPADIQAAIDAKQPPQPAEQSAPAPRPAPPAENPIPSGPAPEAAPTALTGPPRPGLPDKAAVANSTAPVKRSPLGPPPELEAARAQTNPNPTEAEKASGNYQKGVFEHPGTGVKVAIENPAGSTRSGVGEDGKPWSMKMPHDYGEIEGTRGADGDKVDAHIVGPHPRADVIDQKNLKTGQFDEHKVMLGSPHPRMSLEAYRRSFNDGKADERVLGVTPMKAEELRAWLGSGETAKPLNKVTRAAHEAGAAKAARIGPKGKKALEVSSDVLEEQAENGRPATKQEMEDHIKNETPQDIVDDIYTSVGGTNHKAALREFDEAFSGSEIQADPKLIEARKIIVRNQIGPKGKKVLATAKGEVNPDEPVPGPKFVNPDKGKTPEVEALKGLVKPEDYKPGKLGPEGARVLEAVRAEPEKSSEPTPPEPPAKPPKAKKKAGTYPVHDETGAQVSSKGSERDARVASNALKIAGDMFEKHAPTGDDNRLEKPGDRVALLQRIKRIAEDAKAEGMPDYNPRGKGPEETWMRKQMWLRDVLAKSSKKELSPADAAEFVKREALLRGGTAEDIAIVKEDQREKNADRVREKTGPEEEARPLEPAAEPAEPEPEAAPPKAIDEMTPEEIAAKQRAYRGEPAAEPVREAQKLRGAPAGETLSEKIARLKAARLAGTKPEPTPEEKAKARVAEKFDEADKGAPGDEELRAEDESKLTAADKADGQNIMDRFAEMMRDTGGGGFPLGQLRKYVDPRDAHRKLLNGVRAVRGLALRGTDSILERSDPYWGGADRNPLRVAQEGVQNMIVRRRKYANEDAELRKRGSDLERTHGAEVMNRLGELMTGESRATRWADLPNTDKAQGKRTSGPNEAWNNARYEELKAEHDDLMKERPDLAQYRNDIHDMILDRNNAMRKLRVESQLKRRGINDPALVQQLLDNAVTTDMVQKHGLTAIEGLQRVAEMEGKGGPYIPLLREGDKWAVIGKHKVEAPDAFTKQFTDDAGDPKNKYEFDSREAAEEYAAQQKNKPAVHTYFVDEDGNSTYTDTRMVEDENGQQHPQEYEKRYTREDAESDPDLEQRWSVDVNDNHLELFHTRHEALSRQVEMSTGGKFANTSSQPRRWKPETSPVDVANEMDMDFDKGLRNDEIYKSMTDKEKASMRAALAETKLQLIAGARSFNPALKRQGITGYSSNLDGILRNWSNRTAAQRARLEKDPEIDAAIKDAEEMIDKEQSRPHNAADPRAESAMRGQLNELQKRINRVRTEHMTEASAMFNPVIHRILQASQMKRLFTPRFLTLNGTQVFTHTLPILGGEVGVGDATARIAKAYHDINPAAVLRDSSAQLYKVAQTAWKPGVDIRSAIMDKVLARVSGDRRQALQYAIDQGLISEHASYQMEREVNEPVNLDIGTGPSVIRDVTNKSLTGVDRAMQYISDVAEPLSNAPEVINRSVSFLAAYDAARAKGKTFDQATRFAGDIVNKSQVNYGDENKPNWAVHPAMRIPWQFKEFGRRQYENFVDNFDKIKNGSKTERNAGLVAVGGLLLTHQIVAGALHLPWEPVRLAMISANALGFTNKDWEDIQGAVQDATTNALGAMVGDAPGHNGEFAKRMSGALLHGLPRLLGIDTSGQLGLENMAVMGEPKNTGHDRDKKGAILQWLAETAFGASGGMFMDAIEGAQLASKGKIWQATEKALPLRLPTDIMKAIEGYREGAKTDSGRQLKPPYTLPQALAKAFGFNLASDMDGYQASHIKSVETNRRQEAKTNLINAWKTAPPAEKTAAFKAAVAGGVKPADLTRSNNQQLHQKTIGGMPYTKSNKDIVERVNNTYNLPTK